MRNSVKLALIVVALSGLLTNFTNCQVYTDSQVFSALNSQTCTTTACLQSSSDNLEIATAPQVMVRTALTSVDIGGDCNDAGFYSNRMVWQVLNNNVALSGISCVQNCGQCINGRFQTNVYFNSATPSNTWQIRVELIGIDKNNNEYTNPAMAQRTIQVQTF